MPRIRIETRAGKMITRKAVTTDWIDSEGRQCSIAQVGIRLYRVIRRDAEGPIYKVW